DDNFSKHDILYLVGGGNILSENMTIIVTELQKLNKKFDGLDNRISGLEKDMKSVKSDINSVKADVNSVKGDINSVKDDINSVKNDVRSNSKKISAIQEKLEVIEKQTAWNTESYNTIHDNISEKVSNLEFDVKLLKKAVAK